MNGNMQFQDNVKIKKLQWILQVKNCGMSRVPKFVKKGRKEGRNARSFVIIADYSIQRCMKPARPLVGHMRTAGALAALSKCCSRTCKFKSGTKNIALYHTVTPVHLCKIYCNIGMICDASALFFSNASGMV